MTQTKIKAEMVEGDVANAAAVSYDNSDSGLTADNAKAALDELAATNATQTTSINSANTAITAGAAATANLVSGATAAGDATKWNGAAKTVSTSDPSGGADGDIWLKYTA